MNSSSTERWSGAHANLSLQTVFEEVEETHNVLTGAAALPGLQVLANGHRRTVVADFEQAAVAALQLQKIRLGEIDEQRVDVTSIRQASACADPFSQRWPRVEFVRRSDEFG